MSVIGSNILAGASGQGGGYNLDKSLRFRSSASAYLNRTPASAGNRRTWTWSGWVKRGALGSYQQLFGSSISQNETSIYITNSDTLQVYMSVTGTIVTNLITSQVFRDPSAWYHIVVALDTTQATSSNRVKIYVNGVQVTSFGTSTYCSQNTEGLINSANSHNIGRDPFAGASFLDGYLTEVNFIDGQALTPSSFGENNAQTGVWQPKKYAGTYGTNGFYLPFTDATQYYSGSFNGSSQTAYVGYNSVLNLGTSDYTVEAFVNPTSLSNGNGQQQVLGRWVDGSSARSYLLTVNNDGSVTWSVSTNGLSGSGNSTSVSSSAGLVTTNKWTHIRVSQTGGTVYLGINGTIVTSATNSIFNNVYTSTDPVALGASQQGNTATLWTGYISNVRIVKGTALSTSNYTVPTSPLTAISGTSLLTLQSSTLVDNSGNSLTITNPSSNPTISTVFPTQFGGLGKDFSGNSNNWTTNNISLTSGATYDSMTDVPTLTSATASNFATLNPVSKGTTTTLSSANLNFTNSAGSDGLALSTIGVSSGKWYCEVTALGSDCMVGVTSNPMASGSYVGALSTGYGYYQTGAKFNNGSSSAYGASYTTNDVIGIALDLDAGTVVFYKNNVSQGTAFSSLSGTFFFAVGNGSANSLGAINFGQRPFAYTPPTGFVALNTYNLPTPTIGATASSQANKYMDISLYTGNGTTQTITNSGSMQPDLVWIKGRNYAQFHDLTDSVRGGTKVLSSNSTAAEVTDANNITSFNSNGFSIGSSAYLNTDTATFVAWQWRASNTTPVTNTDGSITSTVSANTTSGFSIVTYTGTGSLATVGHGLGVAPKMIISKARTLAGGDTGHWAVQHAGMPSNWLAFLNLTGGIGAVSGLVAPTSTVFTAAVNSGLNTNGSTFVAYCFAEVAGFSKFGSYTGNGSADGVFLYTGFKPKYVMIKSSSNARNWIVQDGARNPNNAVILNLYPNLSDAEGDTTAGLGIDFLSNGIKLRNPYGNQNANGESYIYMAFAENPFKYSLAR